MAVEELNREGIAIAEMTVKFVVLVEDDGRRVVLIAELTIVPEAPG